MPLYVARDVKLDSTVNLLMTIINFPHLLTFSNLRTQLSTFEFMNIKSSTPDLNFTNATITILSSHNVYHGNNYNRGGSQGRGRYGFTSLSQN